MHRSGAGWHGAIAGPGPWHGQLGLAPAIQRKPHASCNSVIAWHSFGSQHSAIAVLQNGRKWSDGSKTSSICAFIVQFRTLHSIPIRTIYVWYSIC